MDCHPSHSYSEILHKNDGFSLTMKQVVSHGNIPVHIVNLRLDLAVGVCSGR